MNFATAKQIITLVVVITVGCYVFDYYQNPQLRHHVTATSASVDKGARLTLWINHLCCSDCLNDARQALAALPGIDAANAIGPKQLLTRAQADQMTASPPQNGNSIELVVSDAERLDFVALFLKARGQSGQLKWLDSVSVDRDAKAIVAHARYLQMGKTVDVTEFLAALNDIGYAPRSVQILVHERANFTSRQLQE